MKLELKHLAPYLPYELYVNAPFIGTTDRITRVLSSNMLAQYLVGERTIKPILRPLSDLIQIIEINGICFVPNQRIQWLFDYKFDYVGYVLDGRLNYEKMQKLLEWHFDVFGLIEKGLAIDINTLSNE